MVLLVFAKSFPPHHLIVVRDHRGQAGPLAHALQGALVTVAPEGPYATRELGSELVRWDACGRLLD